MTSQLKTHWPVNEANYFRALYSSLMKTRMRTEFLVLLILVELLTIAVWTSFSQHNTNSYKYGIIKQRIMISMLFNCVKCNYKYWMESLLFYRVVKALTEQNFIQNSLRSTLLHTNKDCRWLHSILKQASMQSMSWSFLCSVSSVKMRSDCSFC